MANNIAAINGALRLGDWAQPPLGAMVRTIDGGVLGEVVATMATGAGVKIVGSAVGTDDMLLQFLCPGDFILVDVDHSRRVIVRRYTPYVVELLPADCPPFDSWARGAAMICS
jgi:hypothetical protein